MYFAVYGPFALDRKPNGLVGKSGRNAFWERVDQEKETLADRSGCYVFTLNSGGGQKVWYVGKAEGQSFCKEIFTDHKLGIFNDVLASKKGTPQIYLIPRLSKNGKLCWPGKMRRRSVDFLETMLIGMALSRNPVLKNVRDTKLLREITLPAIIKGKTPGHPGKPAATLKRLLKG